MTTQQIKWAAQHDWFVRQEGERIVVIEDDGLATWVGTFRALREWAGY